MKHYYKLFGFEKFDIQLFYVKNKMIFQSFINEISSFTYLYLKIVNITDSETIENK